MVFQTILSCHPSNLPVIPAQAGIQLHFVFQQVSWIPACAGMTIVWLITMGHSRFTASTGSATPAASNRAITSDNDSSSVVIQ